MRARRGEAETFLASAVGRRTEDCILWPFAKTPKGYGRYKSTYAHRLACTLRHGKPSALGMDAAHNCHQPSCINGNHLRWDTRAGNLADMVSDGTDRRGCKSPDAVLTAEQVGRIRACEAGMALLASEFGVSLRYCYKVRAGDKRIYDV